MADSKQIKVYAEKTQAGLGYKPGGLQVREYHAAAIATGILSNNAVFNGIKQDLGTDDWETIGDEIARISFLMADCAMKVRGE